MNPATRILITVISVVFIFMFVVIYMVRGDLLEERRKDTAFYDQALIPQKIIPLTLTSASPYQVLNIEALENNFPQKTITTRTYFTGDKTHTFTGPRMMDVLNTYTSLQKKAQNINETSFWSDKAVIAAAGDDYDIAIPVSEVLERFNPIIATKMDGASLPDEYAPLFIIFDRDGIDALDDSYTQYWVWSLTRLHVASK